MTTKNYHHWPWSWAFHPSSVVKQYKGMAPDITMQHLINWPRCFFKKWLLSVPKGKVINQLSGTLSYGNGSVVYLSCLVRKKMMQLGASSDEIVQNTSCNLTSLCKSVTWEFWGHIGRSKWHNYFLHQHQPTWEMGRCWQRKATCCTLLLLNVWHLEDWEMHYSQAKVIWEGFSI